MAVKVWSGEELLTEARAYAEKEWDGQEAHDWHLSVRKLVERAFERGDGVAVYTNEDLGHPEIGMWQVMSYGSEASQLKTRGAVSDPAGVPAGRYFVHGGDFVSTTLPDIGGRINWRYQLHAIVPSPEQQEKVDAANDNARPVGEALNDPRVPCCERDAADCDCTVTIKLPTPELLELRRVWRTGDDALLQENIVRLVRDIFDGHDGDLQKLSDL